MRLCVFCGSSVGERPVYAQAATALGSLLAERGIGLVYGGAAVGLMGTVANAALAGGAEVIGVLPKALSAREIAHDGLSELHIVGSMHERKAMMSELSDGFISLPGGIGTLEELFEVWTWGQIGYHRKPLALLDVDAYWAALIGMVDNMVAEGFLRAQHRQMLIHGDSAVDVLEQVLAYKPASTPKVQSLDPL